MKDRDSFRGTSIDEKFADSFKRSKFYNEIYRKHNDEVIIGIRDGYINLYYNCDSIAKICVSNPKIAEISRYYIDNEKGRTRLNEDQMIGYYDSIKKKSDSRNKHEKQAQQRLFIDNNKNPLSEWFCIDVEYTKSLQEKDNAERWRFDIIAITKTKPFRVALIELKYGLSAISGPSGIRSHVKDFYSFYKNKSFEFLKLKKEVVSIIKSLSLLGIDMPLSFEDVSTENIAPEPEFYFITLNNPKQSSKTTPKKTMSAHLFSDKRWGNKIVSSEVTKEGDYKKLIEGNKSFKPVFLFSDATLQNLGICDILDRKYYDEEIINDI